MSGSTSDGKHITFRLPNGSFRTRMIEGEEVWKYAGLAFFLGLLVLSVLCTAPITHGTIMVVAYVETFSFACVVLAFVAVLFALKNDSGWGVVAALLGLSCAAHMWIAQTLGSLLPTLLLLGLGFGRALHNWITRAVWEPVLLALLLCVLLGMLVTRTHIDVRTVYAVSCLYVTFAAMSVFSIWVSSIQYERGLRSIHDGGE